jgi:hypothetical protein
VPPDILKVGTIAEKESNEKPKHKSTHSQTSLSYGKTYPWDQQAKASESHSFSKVKSLVRQPSGIFNSSILL